MAPTLLSLVCAGGIFLFFWSLGRARAAGATDTLEARLKVYGQEGVTLDDIELQAPFAERVLLPAFERLTKFFEKQTKAKQRHALSTQLNLTGSRIDAGGFLVIRYGLSLLLFGIGLVLGMFLGQPLYIALAAAIGGCLGFFLPVLWLRQKVGDRRKEIQKSLPDCMDLLTIAVEAGLGLDQAMARVTEKFRNALSNEFAQVLQETRFGRPRLEALDDMGRRNGVDDLHNFVQAVIQSEQMGVGVAKILRLQSEEMRRRRRQRAQEKAAQATLKMMLPMVGCIFPTLWIVLLGPAILIMLARR